MTPTIAIILMMCIGFCFGWKEIAYSYSDIHVPDILSVKPFLACLAVSMTVGMGLMILHKGQHLLTSYDDIVVMMVSMLLTISILSTVNCHFSTVTAFWGTVLSMAVIHEGGVSKSTWTVVLLSVMAAPVLSVICSLLFHQLIQRYIVNQKKHLLVKQYYAKWLAYIGVVLCGIALTCNYALMINAFITPLLYKVSIAGWILWLLLIVMSIVCLSPVLIYVYQRPRNGMMTRHLPSLYALTSVLALFNFLLPLIVAPLPSVIVPANLLKEGNIIALERGKEQKRLLNIVTIAIATPMLSYLICSLLAPIYQRPHVFWVLVPFVLLVCLSIRLSYKQYIKGRNVSRMLNDEIRRSDERSNELNRLDVMAVTSQFDSMSREMDFKHKELIDLSLFVKQQRDYMTGVGEQLRRLSQERDPEHIRKSLIDIDKDLKDTLRYPPEMEQIYQQVEKMHRDFISRLQMRCPNLTKRESRLAILLRLGFSSKEIANMVNLETKSVEINRYRLRKKLRLDRSENLVSYLQQSNNNYEKNCISDIGSTTADQRQYFGSRE